MLSKETMLMMMQAADSEIPASLTIEFKNLFGLTQYPIEIQYPDSMQPTETLDAPFKFPLHLSVAVGSRVVVVYDGIATLKHYYNAQSDYGATCSGLNTVEITVLETKAYVTLEFS